MQRSLFFLLLSMFLFSACHQDLDKASVKHPLFQCCNFYEDGDCVAQDRIEWAICFFEENNIEVSDLEILDDGPIALCKRCCECIVGKSLFLEVADEDLERILALGFTLN